MPKFLNQIQFRSSSGDDWYAAGAPTEINVSEALAEKVDTADVQYSAVGGGNKIVIRDGESYVDIRVKDPQYGNEPASKTYVDNGLEGKADKSSLSNLVSWDSVNQQAVSDTIVQRTQDGTVDVRVPITPTYSNEPTSKDYVDGGLADKQDTINENNKLSADYLQDGNTNKVFTTVEKQQITTNADNIVELNSNLSTLETNVGTNTANITTLIAESGAILEATINSSTYEMTITLKNKAGSVLGTPQVVDLPLESVVVSGAYDAATKEVVLTLKDGSTIRFSVADLVSGLQTEITAQNPLSADLVADGNVNKVFTATEQTKLNGIEAGAQVNAPNTVIDADYKHITVTDSSVSDGVNTFEKFVLPSDVVQDSNYVHTDNNFTTAEKDKLTNIEAGAQVNAVDSVNGQTGAVLLDADNIDDTNTTNKFITTAEKTQIATNTTNIAGLQANKLDKNTSIAGATKTKITYDNNGLVVAGSDLQASDIPTIEENQVNGLPADLQNIREVAEGKCKAFVVDDTVETAFDSSADLITVTSFEDIDGNTINVADLNKGDVVYTITVGVLDRWLADPINGSWHILNADDPDLTNYYTKTDTQSLFYTKNEAFIALNNKVDKITTANKVYIVSASGSQASVDLDKQTANTTFIPTVAGGRVMDMGDIIDFHKENSIVDYDTRLQADPNANQNWVTLPANSGTLALTSQIPTTYPLYQHHIAFNNPTQTGSSTLMYFEFDVYDTINQELVQNQTLASQFIKLATMLSGASVDINGFYNVANVGIYNLIRIAYINTDNQFDVSGFNVATGSISNVRLYADDAATLVSIYTKPIHA